MNAGEIVKEIMRKQGKGNAEVGAQIGMTGDAIWARINRKNISIDNLQEMLAVLGYELAIVPRGAVKQTDTTYPVEWRKRK